jgi:hypothetical protein
VWFQLFYKHPSILSAPYSVGSAAAPYTVRHFLNVLDGGVPITNDNAEELLVLCDEFGCEILKPRIAPFLEQGRAGV